jgi:hypothetical protein
MAAQFADRIRVNTTTTGTGTVTLGTAILGFRTFLAAVTAGALTSPASVYYVIEDTGGAWEVGSGVYTTGVETLTRVVAASSLGGTILTLSGAAQVYLALTAASVMTDNITSGTISGVTINSSTIGQTTANLGTFTALTATGATSLASLTATGATTLSTSLAVGTPTGGAMGTGTINATALYVNGTAISGSVIAASAPTSPASGALWWNTGDDKLYIWVGSAWSEATNETVPIASTSVPGTVIAGAGLAVTTTGLLSVAAPVGISVMSYGATGNGTTDDSTAINNAIAAAVTAGGGVVYFPPGTYAIGSTIVLQSLVTLRGAGRTATTIEGLPGTTMDLVQTHQFTTLTGSNTAAGPYRFGIIGMSLNGNARNGGRCVAIYGYNYIIEDAEFFGAHGDGFYSEWCTSGLVPVTAGGESMEAHFFRTTFYSNGGNGLTFNGPHDTILTDTLTFLNKGSGAVFQQSPTYIGACVIMGMHSYGNSQVGVIIGTGCYAAQLQSENNRATGGICIVSHRPAQRHRHRRVREHRLRHQLRRRHPDHCLHLLLRQFRRWCGDLGT